MRNRSVICFSVHKLFTEITAVQNCMSLWVPGHLAQNPPRARVNSLRPVSRKGFRATSRKSQVDSRKAQVDSRKTQVDSRKMICQRFIYVINAQS